MIFGVFKHGGLPEGLRRREDVIALDDFKSYTDGGHCVDGFIIAETAPQRISTLLNHIRKHPLEYEKPAFLIKHAAPELAVLSDGYCNTFDRARRRTREIRLLSAQLPVLEKAVNKDQRLLRFLYTRTDYHLRPMRDFNHPHVYHYPLLTCFKDRGSHEGAWLESLVERKLLEQEKLIDRIRLCSSCDSVYLNYLDVCKRCNSLSIEQKPFIHCFSCGHVAPQDDFHFRGTLTCPKCTSRLRHIGQDYDRPLENYECNGCKHVFEEPHIVARCYRCGSDSEPNQLVTRAVYTHQLSEAGRVVVRTGGMDQLLAVFDSLNYVTPGYFNRSLNWMLSIAGRHRDQVFSILGLSLNNVDAMIAQVGNNSVVRMLDAFAVRVRELLRDTDISTRSGDGMIWILLPRSDRKGCLHVQRRLYELQKLSQKENGMGLSLDTVSYTAPEDLTKGEDAELLMAKLTAELSHG